jgi:tetratricopeptide (TPR) repeat protein
VDTLRADRLPLYGNRNVETPNLDALGKDSILFENAYSHVPLTLPSHATLFTGLLPPQNGVRDNLGYRLAETPETLAGFLKKGGYATAGAVSSIVLARTTGIARGFDFYDDDVEPTAVSQSLSRVQRGGAETARRLTEWIRGRGEGKPFFAFLHLFEPHTPYDPPEPYRSRYAAAYDGEIARADEILGDFLRVLKEDSLYDSSLIFFLSDHGEGLEDHGEQEHGVFLYREALRVPFLVKLPEAIHAGKRVGPPVGLIDVFPTIARLVGLDPPEGLPGPPLTDSLAGTSPAPRQIYSETLYPRIHLGWSDLASLVDERHHYIEAPRPELYDVVADPFERVDLAGGLPPAFRALRASLAKIPRPLQPPGGSDPEQVQKLAALGYISAGSPDFASKPLTDPKDRIGDVQKLKTGFGHLTASRHAEAAAIFGELLRDNPNMTDVWQLLAQCLMRLGRPNEAHQALQKAAKLSPGNPQVLLALAEFYLESRRFKEARQHAELARDAGAPNTQEELARIGLAEGDLVAAEREALAALKEHPHRRIPRLILARIKRDRGDLLGAMAELESASRAGEASKHPPLSSLSFLRGDVLARLGREQEAEASFREEIREFPMTAEAWTSLAVLFASQGREAEARATLEGLLKKVQTPEAFFAAGRTYEVLGDPASAARVRVAARRLFPGSAPLTGG